MSHHRAWLRGCGIITGIPQGWQTRYEIADPHFTRALEALVVLVLAVEAGVACTEETGDLPHCRGTES